MFMRVSEVLLLKKGLILLKKGLPLLKKGLPLLKKGLLSPVISFVFTGNKSAQSVLVCS